MLAPANHTVQINSDLLAEIEESQKIRAFKRAQKTDPELQSF
jgi:hypothetical protein